MSTVCSAGIVGRKGCREPTTEEEGRRGGRGNLRPERLQGEPRSNGKINGKRWKYSLSS